MNQKPQSIFYTLLFKINNAIFILSRYFYYSSLPLNCDKGFFYFLSAQGHFKPFFIINNNNLFSSRHFSTSFIHNIKSSNRSNYWETYYSLNQSSIITSEILKNELKLFFKYYSENFNQKFFAIMFKIKFPNGDYRTCSKLQIYTLDDFDKLFSHLSFVFNYENIFDEVSEELNKDVVFKDGLPIGNIIFDFKPLNNINTTKYTDFIPNDQLKLDDDNMKYKEDKDLLSDFKFKGVNLPLTMDLSLWGKIKFSSNFKTAYLSYKSIQDNILLDFLIIIYDLSYQVVVKNNHNEVFTFTDESLNNNKDLNVFKRTITDGKNKKVYYINNGKIEFYLEKKHTKFITRKNKDIVNFNMPKILTLDIETKLNKDNNMIPICLSIFDGKNSNSHILNPHCWEKDMTEALKTLMKRKYDNYKIYLHNFSYFDSIFMIDTLSQLGELTPFIRDNKILKLTFNFKSDKGRKHTLHFYDSLLIFPDSLANLSRSFKVEKPKTHFPLLFLNIHNLDINYEGRVPAYVFFPLKRTDKFTIQDYHRYCENFKGKKWNLKNELVKYCENDTIALYQIITKFRMEIYGKFSVDITKYPTLASITFAIFRTKFLKENTIPVILSKLYHTLKQSYFGGIIDTYKGIGYNIRSYDVNSLYPFIMRNLGMPIGTPYHFVGNIFNFSNYIDNPFGFFKVKVTAPLNLNKPFLPFRAKTNNVMRTIFPVGTWTGWYFSEEILNAQKYGYKFEVL